MNKVILVGRLTRDPELKHPKPDLPVASFSLAIQSTYGKNKSTDFINCTAFNKTAEIISKYVLKGALISVVGRLKTTSYKTKDGETKYRTDVLVQEVTFLSSGGTSKKSDLLDVEINFDRKDKEDDEINTDDWQKVDNIDWGVNND